jgi:hypothetical protein
VQADEQANVQPEPAVPQVQPVVPQVQRLPVPVILPVQQVRTEVLIGHYQQQCSSDFH